VAGSGAGNEVATLVVLNPSGWARTDLVRVFVPESRVASEIDFSVVDGATGEREPRVVQPQEHARFRPAGRFVSFVARDVPACGFRLYALVEAGEGDDVLPAGEQFGLEAEHLRLELDQAEGFVGSLVELESGRELIDETSAFGFNQYVYDRYASAANLNHLSGRIPPDATGRWLLGGRTTGRYPVLVERSSNPVWESVTIRLEADGAEWLESSYRLIRGLARLDIVNRLAKVSTSEKEGVYFAFPFALGDPEIDYETTGGVTSARGPHVPGSAGHMRAVRHWVALADASGGAVWATLEAPLVQSGNLYLPYAPFPETVAPGDVGPGTLFSWVMNNLWDTNFPPAQGGVTTFRYAVAPSTGPAPARGLGLRTAASLSSPLVGICTPPGRRGTGSFLALDREDVELVTVERSRRGHDLVAFLQSCASEPVELRVEFPDLRVARAFAGTFLERDLREVGDGGGATLELPANGFAALVLDLRNDE
jgi:hypothetical protein